MNDQRGVRLSGRDQKTEQMWGATLWLPQEQPDNYMVQAGDRAMRDLVNGVAGNEHIAGLAAYQRFLPACAQAACQGPGRELKNHSLAIHDEQGPQL